ncbi:MAG: acyl carrier protein [Myxococcales bacterium]|jgi:acyl carrier protein|nr:acyl carrier protein [Myxococcales bacterium]
MATSDDLLTYIKTELAVNTPELDVETNLGGIVDSTAVMEIVVWIEGKYGFDVEIDDIVPDNFGSVAKLAAYVERRKKA